MKLKNFCKAKDTINQTEWEKSFPNTSNRGQHPKYIFKKTQAIRYQENNLMKRGYRAKQRGNPNSWETLKEMFNILSHQGNANQNYFEISFYNILHHSEWLRSTEQMTAHAVEDVEWEEPSSIAGGSTNSHSHYGNQCGGSLGKGESASRLSYTTLVHIPEGHPHSTTMTFIQLCSFLLHS